MVIHSSIEDTGQQNPAKSINAVDAARRFSRLKPLAEKIGVTSKTIRNWAEKHPEQIHLFKVSEGTTLVDVAEVQAFIEKGRL